MSELYDILTETPPTKVVLLALDQGLWDCERSLAELSALCEANHMEAVAQITQKRQTPETGIVLGSGKLEEASLAAQTLGAECAVFDGELTGSQIRNISNALGGLEVIDRTMLILEIFRSRAPVYPSPDREEEPPDRFYLYLSAGHKALLLSQSRPEVLLRHPDQGFRYARSFSALRSRAALQPHHGTYSLFLYIHSVRHVSFRFAPTVKLKFQSSCQIVDDIMWCGSHGESGCSCVSAA